MIGHVHPEVQHEVANVFVELLRKNEMTDYEILFKQAREIVATSCQIEWVSFQKQYGLGVFSEIKND
jgi:predicted nucleotide-binding protein (sugar kinase/HSP70/actin superfamily)